MGIVVLIIVGIVLIYLFSPAKKKEKGSSEPKNYQAMEAKAYQALDNFPNPNQDELIRTVFSLAEDAGGLWCITFTSDGVTIYEKNGEQKYIPLSRLGYGELSLHKYLTFKGEIYQEFPYRLKREAESKGYLYWTAKGYGYAEGSTYTSRDGGHSFTLDGEDGTYTKSVSVCSKEYYQTFKPYSNPDAPPLKKYKKTAE